MEVLLRPDQLYTPPPMADLSMAGHRLLWTLQGPLSSSVFVLPEDRNPDGAREPLLRQTPAGVSWHPIAQEPVTHIPVASLTVKEAHLDEWQDEWYTINQEGFDEDVQPDPADFPPKFDPLVVRASSRDFVTVQDFVSAVHPWLMERRGEILRAINVADEEHTTREREAAGVGRPARGTVGRGRGRMDVSIEVELREGTIAPPAGDIYKLIRSLR